MSRAREIRGRIRRLEEIPTLPEFFNRLMETIEDDRCSARDLAAIITEDQALTSKILKLANSAYYGCFRRVGTIEEAVTLIGFNEVKSASLSVAVFGSFSKKLPLEMLQDFWVHALSCATATRAIGDRRQEVSLEKLYVGALLHDIGKLVLNLLFGSEYIRALELAAQQGCPLHEAEKEVFTVQHAQVGGWLAERWHFPDELVEVLQRHHHPFQADVLRPRAVLTVWLADCVANQSGGEGVTDASTEGLDRGLNELRMNPEEMAAVSQNVREQQGRIQEIFSLISRG
jgi:putative nucleotidyltransferase with HDIG domain